MQNILIVVNYILFTWNLWIQTNPFLKSYLLIKINFVEHIVQNRKDMTTIKHDNRRTFPIHEEKDIQLFRIGIIVYDKEKHNPIKNNMIPLDYLYHNNNKAKIEYMIE